MIKTCTESRCRRSFNTSLDTYTGCCPYCGKAYPRLPRGAPRFNRSQRPGFCVFLHSFGDQKIRVVKVVRDTGHLSLAEAKRLVGSAPTSLGFPLSRDQALSLTEKLRAFGCDADLSRSRRHRRR